jgi:hypothetical protein
MLAAPLGQERRQAYDVSSDLTDTSGGFAMLNWWRRLRDKKMSGKQDGENLPFTAEEFANLIRNGSRDDFKRLAAGLGDPRRVRRPL